MTFPTKSRKFSGMKRNSLDTSKSSQVALPPQGNTDISKAKRRRRFDAQSIEEYAELAAKRFTDEEICSKFGWLPNSFKKWKARASNSSTLAHLVTRARQAKLEAHLTNIEEASKGEGAHARADWRASAHIMEVMDRTRFGRGETNTGGTVNNTAIVIAAGGEEQLKKLIEGWITATPERVIDCPDVKQIKNGKSD